ncbi:LANO_0G00188g1_1 [Lachancea nothofagi CBS 11611]|uniref:LANO_0G00188g1_1 n=1 Tax=Lachancea nothofagi CBS 11611 TaxID=1266666 RepID=A0A1G4KEA5_9SACH|nr:LANO_0G00188g1_1 [Lachancea nothofagi CBS 11611]
MSEELTMPQVVDDLTGQQDYRRTFKDIAAGTAGGIAQVLVGQPFDITKVRLQTSSTPTTAVKVIQNLVRNEGPKAFYKGTTTPLIGVGACVSCQFGVNEAMKRYFHRKNNYSSSTLKLPEYYACGFISGSANGFLTAPIEHVRIRLQLQTTSLTRAEYSGAVDCIKKLVASGKLMRGLTPTLLRTSHGFGVYFLTYEALLISEAKRGIARGDIHPWKLCMYGAFSGALLWMTVYPLDVIKSVMQSDNLRQPVHGSNLVQVAKYIYRERGLKAFFNGFGPTMIRSLPVNGATFTTFELAMRLMG